MLSSRTWFVKRRGVKNTYLVGRGIRREGGHVGPVRLARLRFGSHCNGPRSSGSGTRRRQGLFADRCCDNLFRADEFIRNNRFSQRRWIRQFNDRRRGRHASSCRCEDTSDRGGDQKIAALLSAVASGACLAPGGLSRNQQGFEMLRSGPPGSGGRCGRERCLALVAREMGHRGFASVNH